MTYAYIKDWSKSTFKNIEKLFNVDIIAPKNTMEIGVFEGKTTFWMLDNYPSIKSHIAIDPFRGNYNISDDVLDMIEDRFYENMTYCKSAESKLTFIKSKSTEALYNVHKEHDFIYIDGDHTANVVLNDLVLSFNALRTGGVLLCDDATNWKYTDHANGNKSGDISLCPRLAIDAFIHCNWKNLEVLTLPANNQVAIKKI